MVDIARLNILDRFRPVGAPGPAVRTGSAAELRGPAAELAPVFAALAADLELARSLTEDAEQSAEKMLADARARASGMTAQARLDAGGEHARAASAVEKASAERDESLMERAHEEASDLETRAADDLTAVAQHVVERMITDLLDRGASTADRGGGRS